ncbi:sperm flagellar protein 2 isoform X3 [Scleropages formosus]|uniref:sperm flagellar protein 2 isoform X3 n=1 Tax=Scleropages formosus TaxID=113540 RepID=UPI0010FAAAE2|nr:sperm flagellar protein 2 isoform X3 [Scleropages formosus]
MSDILCRWLNSELRLSKPVEPKTLCADLANGYLIGEVLHKYDLQPDFHRFSRSSTANAKLNNYTRLEPTMQLLGVHFDLCFAQALMQEHPGAATRLLYQLYFLLQKKKKAQLSGVAMETLQSTATAHLHRIERGIYSERLRTVVKRDVDNKLQKISQKYERKGQEMLRRSTMAQYEKELELQKLRLARKRRNEMMVKIQKATVQIPRPPRKQVLRTLEHQHHKQQEAQDFQRDIEDFERNMKKQLPASALALSTPFTFSVKTDAALRPEQLAQANDEYIQRIRQRLEEDAAARQQREKRRSRILVLQQEAQEEQEELNRDERLLACLTRQSQQERRLAVQLMQVRQQKEFLRQNRIFREKQYQEQRLREFQEALDRKAALAQQTQLEHEQETQRETELHRQITAQRAQARYRSHFDTCREVLDQILNLVTKVGEYRLLMDNLIPVKLMREWKELLLLGLPLYGESASPEPSPQELEKLEVLNNQDYDDYTSMTGEWAWPEEGDAKQPPPNNNILGHVVHRLNVIVDPPKPETPPPSFPSFTLKASVLGKVFAGKSGCLARMAQVHGVHVLSTSILIQEALEAFLAGEKVPQAPPKEPQYPEGSVCLRRTAKKKDVAEKEKEKSSRPDSGHVLQSPQQENAKRTASKSEVLTSPPQLSARAQHGAALDEVLGKGQAIPDQLLVDIVLEAIRRVPPESGWILDGFPMDLDQAKLLEKALSGIDPEKVERKKNNKKINLVVDPHAKKEAPPPLPALDVVLLMDLSDDLVLDRAAKKANEMEGKLVQIQTLDEMCALAEAGSPPEPCPSTQTPDLRDKSLEMAQVQHRIAAFHDTWPKLEWWYSNRQKILVKVNADEEPDAVFKEVESIVYKIMAPPADKGVDATPTAQTAQAPGVTPPPLAMSSSPAGPPAQKSPSESRIHSPDEGVPADAAPEAPVPEVPQGKRPSPRALPMSQSTEVVYVDKPLPKEFPEYLVPYWENTCTSYVTNIKAAMQNLRAERDLIIQHLYDIRQEFKHYLMRPDLKQEFVTQWQQDYNSIPEDMRADEDTKAELHQRLNDLSERLWDISERRKEEALQERTVLMGDGWLEDHTAMLINHFSTLMQVEVDRFQDTVHLLRDYYRGMSGQNLPETRFAHVPMVDVAEDARDEDPTGSVQPEQQDTSAGTSEEEESKTKIIPLIPRRPRSGEAALIKPNASTDPHPDEQLLHDIWQTAVTAVNNLVSQEMPQLEPEEGKEAQYVAEQGPSQPAAQSAKDNEKPGNTKGGVPEPSAPEQAPSPPPQVEEDVEVVRRKTVKAQIRKEFAAALSHEDNAVKVRLELVRARALRVLRSLHCQADQAYSAMEEWLHTRFQAEMNSINQLVEVSRHHIEAAAQIQHELVLEGPDFFIDGDTRVVPASTPPPCPPPWELPVDNAFTIRQLEALYAQLRKVAPAGRLCAKELSEILEDLASLDMGSDALPELWSNLSASQIQDMVSLVSQDSEVLDWRRFLLSAALPWPLPSQSQLLEVLDRFRATDSQGTGFVTEELYRQTELWFSGESGASPPADSSEPSPFDRLSNLKKFFFALFADLRSPEPRLHYETMLLYFAAHPDRVRGWVRALGVATGRLIYHRPRSAVLLKSVPHVGDEESYYERTDGEAEPGGTEEGKGVSIAALLKVVCHGGTRTSSYNRFHPNWRTWEEYEEDFRQLYAELGFGPEEEVPFATLSQHPLIQNLMEDAVQYRLTDIHQLVLAQAIEGESPCFPVP